ncbi:hypothetical protein LJK87_29090 [Paenibacillus sp. P25]|nr:hypothetical protein LJK87_29090 [Paenibacillus sp. P25]
MRCTGKASGRYAYRWERRGAAVCRRHPLEDGGSAGGSGQYGRCGDAFVAGFAVGTFRQESPEACLRLAVAAGAANALSDRAGSVDPDKAWEPLESVEQIRP